MEDEEQNIHMNMVTFRNIDFKVVREMAKLLDTTGEASWEALADWLGYSSVDIRVISSLLLCDYLLLLVFVCWRDC